MSRLDYSKYLFYEDIKEHLLYLEKQYPDMMKLKTIEITDEGRNIYLAEITRNINKEGYEEKGAYYVQGGIHANECGGSSAAMYLIDTLLNKNPQILDEVVFYVIPRVNPDNIEDNMLTNADSRSKMVPNPKCRENAIVVKDINGDGKTLQMRKENPLGSYKEAAPGVMVPRVPGDTGKFYDVYPEGYFENYSGTELSYSFRNIDYNRSFPYNWKPTMDAPEYPLRAKEVRAVAEFLVTHPNIFAAIDFHNGTSAVMFPCMKPESQFNREDLQLIKHIGNMAADITGLPFLSEYLYSDKNNPIIRHGVLPEFLHYNLGISCYTIELGNGLNDIGLRIDDPSYGYIEYLPAVQKYEEENGNHVFYPFEPFVHPQLGVVEIGGAFRGTSYFMNSKNLLPLIDKTTDFILEHAKMGPKLAVDNCEVMQLADNMYRVRAQIKNIGYMGTKIIKETTSYQAKYPVHIYLEGDGFKIYSRPNVYEIPEMNSMESTYVEWFIKAENTHGLRIVANHPKALTVSVPLKK